MENSFYIKVANSTAHRPIRDLLSGEVVHNKNLLPQLITIALTTHDKNHHKACWILELVIEAQPQWLQNYLTDFCDALSVYKHEGALRSVSKICLFALRYNIKKSGFLTTDHLRLITEACFDWLIDPDGKVATKAYAMRALHLSGKTEEWIYPELARILIEDFVKHSAAYKAAAKDILKKIGR